MQQEGIYYFIYIVYAESTRKACSEHAVQRREEMCLCVGKSFYLYTYIYIFFVWQWGVPPLPVLEIGRKWRCRKRKGEKNQVTYILFRGSVLYLGKKNIGGRWESGVELIFVKQTKPQCFVGGASAPFFVTFALYGKRDNNE